MSIDATETEESLPDPDSMDDMSETEQLHRRELEGQPGTADGREPEREPEREPGAAVDGEMDREVSIVLGGQLEQKKVIFKVWSCVWGRDVKGYKCNIYFVIA